MKLTTLLSLLALLFSLAALTWQYTVHTEAQAQLQLNEQRLTEVRNDSEERHDQLNTVMAQLRAARAGVPEAAAQAAQLSATVAQLQEFTHPSYEAVWAQAQEAARQQLEVERTAQLRRERLQMARRLDNIDLEARSAHLQVESQFSSALRAQGINGERLDSILAALGNVHFENGNHLESYRSGLISEADYEALIEGKTVRDELQRQLSAEEFAAISASMRASANMSTMRSMMIRTINPAMDPDVRQLMASVYVETVAARENYPTSSANPDLNRYRHAIDEVIPRIRESLSAVLGPEDMQEVERYLEYELARNESEILLVESAATNP